MIRHTLSLVTVVLVSAVVGAQGPETLSPAQRGKLYTKNRAVIERLVEKTVESARFPNDHLKRADAYYRVLLEFSREIRDANAGRDSARVSELTTHLTTLLKDGLAPTLDRAKGQVEGGSGVEDFPRIKGDLVGQINVLLELLEPGSPARGSLDNAKTKVNAIALPAKK